MKKRSLLFLFVLVLPPVAGAQVVINEVCSNPAGTGSDPRYEFVEIYGTPGMSLDGYMLAAVFGGGDGSVPPDGIPGPLLSAWNPGDEMPEINQAWTLDGRTIGTNGLFVLYNNNLSNSLIPARLAAATNRATFQQCNILAPGAPTGLSDIRNNGSQNYMLIRRRPLHSMSGATSVYAPGYSWYRNVNPDVNFDGRIDLNGVGTVIATGLAPAPETPVQSQEPGAPPTPGPVTLEPYQMVDEFGCTDGDGRTYFRSAEQKISDTPGGNPDGICRVAYYGSNPDRGWRVDHTSGLVVRTRTADEEFIYGELDVNAISLMRFDAMLSGGPTDPNGAHYNALGQPDPSGTYLFNDISRVGYHMTPGNFNDVDSTAAGGANVVQFRFLRGDFNFDGVVNQADMQMIQGRLGATLDDQITIVDTRGTAATADDVSRPAWKWQGRDFNAVLAMMNMNTGDGPGGTNAPSVTQADIDAERALVPCPADFNHVGGVTVQDIFDFLGAWFSGDPAADFNHVGGITVQDIFEFLAAWFGGC